MKVVLLLVATVSLFLVGSWLGMALFAAVCSALLALSGIRFSRILKVGFPVYVIGLFSLVFNGMTFDVANASTWGATQVSIHGAFLSGIGPIALVGGFGVVPSGLEVGAFFAVRIILIAYASFIVCFTTTSTVFVEALCWFLSPLRALKAPVDDAAMVFSLALRFIPVCANQVLSVKEAQLSRGGKFEQFGIWSTLKAWAGVFVPVFVGLFRQADRLAMAMDARCYGGGRRTQLSVARTRAADIVVLIAGIALAVLACVI